MKGENQKVKTICQTIVIKSCQPILSDFKRLLFEMIVLQLRTILCKNPRSSNINDIKNVRNYIVHSPVWVIGDKD